jgi:hypothetical protein
MKDFNGSSFLLFKRKMQDYSQRRVQALTSKGIGLLEVKA